MTATGGCRALDGLNFDEIDTVIEYFKNNEGEISGYFDYMAHEEFDEVIRYTARKIKRYPKRFGYTVRNYFGYLFPDEVRNYLVRRGVAEAAEVRGMVRERVVC